MTGYSIRGLLIIISLYFCIKYLPGMNLVVTEENGFLVAFIVTAALVILAEAIITPTLNAFLFPLHALTLGLSALFLSAFLIFIISNIYAPFVLASFFEAILFAIVLTIIRFGTSGF